MVKILLRQTDIEVNGRSTSGGVPAIRGAALNGHVGVLRILVEDPRVDVDLQESREKKHCTVHHSLPHTKKVAENKS